VSPERRSIGCGVAALAAYGGALAAVVRGYPHALDNACPDGAPAPLAFWPLLLAAVALAVAAFKVRPRRRDEYGGRSGADVFSLFVVIAVPLAALVTIFGYEIAYACWE
jgi:hypothetical protein